MSVFRTWESYRIFERSVKREARYIHSADVDEFFEIVIATSGKREVPFPSGSEFWRAQLGHAWATVSQNYENEENEQFEVESPYPPERMNPLRDKAKEGRANAKGIPYLYLATDKETAMAEVRPWIGACISVGLFKTLKDFKLVDLSVHTKPGTTIYLKEPDVDKREIAVWTDIDKAFSEPVTNNDSSPDYAPTQILSELFRHHGYDGVVYKSSLGKGRNVVLFDINAADLLNCYLYKVESVSFKFEQSGNPYYIRSDK